VYDGNDQFSLTEELVKKQRDGGFMNDGQCFQALQRHGMRLKHDGFKEEKEWRLVGMQPEGSPNWRVRAGRTTLIPYVELCFADHPELIKEVVHGPSVFGGPSVFDKGRAGWVIHRFLEQLNLADKVQGRMSLIPFRDIV
jgi:hypothetical protein